MSGNINIDKVGNWIDINIDMGWNKLVETYGLEIG